MRVHATTCGKENAFCAAHARAEVAVHHLDDGPFVQQRAVDRERAHVVREADVGSEAAHARDRALEPFVLDARAPGALGRNALRPGLGDRVVVEHADVVAGRLQRGQSVAR